MFNNPAIQIQTFHSGSLGSDLSIISFSLLQEISKDITNKPIRNDFFIDFKILIKSTKKAPLLKMAPNIYSILY